MEVSWPFDISVSLNKSIFAGKKKLEYIFL